MPGACGSRAEGAPAAPSRLRVLVAIVALAIVYGVAATLGLRLALVERNITPLWPPTGVAVVALLLFGTRLWPGVAIGALVVNLPITTSAGSAVATAAGNTLAPLAAVGILRAAGFRIDLDRIRDVAALLVAALVGMVVSATIGVSALVLSSQVPGREFWSAWSVWWAGDTMGILVVAPFLLVLARLRPSAATDRWRRRVEAVALFTVLVVVCGVAFTATVSMLFIVLPVVAWAAWRFHQVGAAPATLVASIGATWAAVAEHGPFAGRALFERMLTLQGFNATIAFSAFFLAALVSERARARVALEQGAAELETRVRRRTAELSRVNERLAREIAERREAEERLRRSERQLAEAHEVARIGAWEWDLTTDRVVWSDEMYRIHGSVPGAFDVTFDRAMAYVVEEDRPRIRRNVELALARLRLEIPDIDYRIVLPDGRTRFLHARSKLSISPEGAPVRMFGIVQDVTERREFERHYRIADTLQRALLPPSFPDVDGVRIAARYLPGETGFAAGGDWYDVIPLGRGSVALVIGDVAGHGLEAATLMGRLRMAVRAYALEGHPPGVVAERTDALVRSMAEDMATMAYVALDPGERRATVVSAGHPAPMVIDEHGSRRLPVEVSPPLGFGGRGRFAEHAVVLEPETTMLLYTDGLIDRRDLELDDAIARLVRALEADPSVSPDELCDRLLGEMVSGDVSDDIALLAARLEPVAGDELEFRVPAEPLSLAPARQRIARWLADAGVPRAVMEEVVLASSEAASNAIRHAYGPADGWVDVRASMVDHGVTVVVRDGGAWRSPRGPGGRGLAMMRACMSSVEIDRGADGTEVRMRRSLDR